VGPNDNMLRAIARVLEFQSSVRINVGPNYCVMFVAIRFLLVSILRED